MLWVLGLGQQSALVPENVTVSVVHNHGRLISLSPALLSNIAHCRSRIHCRRTNMVDKLQPTLFWCHNDGDGDDDDNGFNVRRVVRPDAAIQRMQTYYGDTAFSHLAKSNVTLPSTIVIGIRHPNGYQLGHLPSLLPVKQFCSTTSL